MKNGVRNIAFTDNVFLPLMMLMNNFKSFLPDNNGRATDRISNRAEKDIGRNYRDCRGHVSKHMGIWARCGRR